MLSLVLLYGLFYMGKQERKPRKVRSCFAVE